jgi:hypothetical protein
VSAFFGLLLLFGIPGAAVWWWVRTNRTEQDVCRKHRPMVVMDGTVDRCGSCGQQVRQ